MAPNTPAPLRVRMLTALILAIGGAAAFPWVNSFAQTFTRNLDVGPVESSEQDLARAKYWLLRRGVHFGVPNGAYQAAASQMTRLPAPAAAFSWSPIGPTPMNNALPNFGGPIPGATYDATGRLTSIVADPTNPGTVYAGAANGGVWVSNNSGTSWSPISDSLPTTAIGAIAIDAVNTTPATLYVATGEGNNALDSYYGQGIFRSLDLGSTWTPLAPGTFDHAAFSRLAVDASHNPAFLFAAATPFAFSAGRADPIFRQGDLTKGGLWRSQDGGNTWTQYSPATFGCQIGPNAPCPAQDVVIDSQDPGHVCVGIEFDDVFCSFNGGITWVTASLPGIPPGLNHMDRQSLAVGPPTPGAPMACLGGTQPCGTLYAMIGSITSQAYVGFFKSIDGGTTWTAGNVPSWPNPNGTTIDGTAANNFSQEFYDQTLLVSPLDPTAVFFGGVGIYQTADSGNTWSFLGQNGGVHSDQHALAVASDNDTVYLGNDGGAFSFSISGISGGVATFTSLNATLSAGQIQGVGPHPTNDAMVLAGFQDNGTNLYTGTLNWNQVETGDGGFTNYAPSDATRAFHTFAAGGPGVFFGTSSDGGSTWRDLGANLAGFGDPGAAFYPPLVPDPTNAQRLLLGGHFVYVIDLTALTISLQSPQNLTGVGCGDTFCALQDLEFASGNMAWALSMQEGSVPFSLYNTMQANLNGGASWTNVNATLPFNPAATQATGIAVDPNNVNNAVLSLSGFTATTGVGHIFKTTNFGANWTRADGAGGPSPLPDIPVLRVLVARTDPTGNTFYAATDIGVFQSVDGGGTWAPFNLGAIPAVAVFDIEQNANGTIFAATHGRGAYRLQLGAAPFSTNQKVRVASGVAGRSMGDARAAIWTPLRMRVNAESSRWRLPSVGNWLMWLVSPLRHLSQYLT